METTSSRKLVFVHNPNHILHHPGKYHPEKPDRLSTIVERLDNAGFFKESPLITDFPSYTESLASIHSPEYIEYVKNLPNNSEGDSYSTTESYQAAESGVSGICFAVDKVLNNEFDNAFCLIRPPGHHANTLSNCITGFCLYNNVAIAAKYAMKKYNVKKILIFDWDVHHGDSTQKFFFNDPNVLFCSIHKYLNGSFFPGHSGALMNVGEGEGKGYNINCPWDITEEAGCVRTVGDNEYVYLIEGALMPIINSFQPDFVFVSAGFDSANGDHLGGVSLSPFGYSYMLHRLLSLGKKVVVSLEGGYNPSVNALCAEYCVRTLLGEQLPVNSGSEKWHPETMRERCLPNKIGLDLTERVILNHRQYWPSLDDEIYSTYREQIKKNVIASKKQDLLLSANPLSLVKKRKLWKELKTVEHSVFSQALDKNSFIHQSLQPLLEYLPVSVRKQKRDNLLFSVYDLDLQNINELSYFIIKVGCQDLGADREAYLNKEVRLIKVVVRDRDNKIMEKWDEDGMFGLNYDVKINDYDFDRFIFFVRFFLESQERDAPNKKAFHYFREFVEKLESWLGEKSRLRFSSFSFGFFLNNIKKWYKACLLDFGNLEILESGEQGLHNTSLHTVLQEMKNTLHDDENFVLEN